MRMVGRSRVQIEIELDGDIFRLKLGIALFDGRNEGIADPLRAVFEA
jgi:hypothetical protein